MATRGTQRAKGAAWRIGYGTALTSGILVFLMASTPPVTRFFLTLLTWTILAGLVVLVGGLAPKASVHQPAV